MELETGRTTLISRSPAVPVGHQTIGSGDTGGVDGGKRQGWLAQNHITRYKV
jgi:hypothetical protein